MSAAQPPALPHLSPTSGTERLLTLDVLRGIALLGILSVNIHEFRSPELFAQIVGIRSWDAQWDLDSIAAFLTYTFSSGRWVLIYSFLFGLGIQLICDRCVAKGQAAFKVVSRRLGVLFGFGLLHLTFLWFGDILTMYAVLGFAILLLHGCRPKVHLIVAGVLITASTLFHIGIGALAAVGEMIEPSSSTYDESDWFYQHYMKCFTVYGEGT